MYRATDPNAPPRAMKRYFCKRSLLKDAIQSYVAGRGSDGLIVAGIRKGTGLAVGEPLGAFSADDLAIVVDSLAAHGARNPRRLVARHLASVQGNRDPLRREEFL